MKKIIVTKYYSQLRVLNDEFYVMCPAFHKKKRKRPIANKKHQTITIAYYYKENPYFYSPLNI